MGKDRVNDPPPFAIISFVLLCRGLLFFFCSSGVARGLGLTAPCWFPWYVLFFTPES